MPSSWSIPGVYNALDTFPPALTGMAIGNTGMQNQAALQACINAALNGGGGIVLIPSVDNLGTSGTYQIQPPGGGVAAVTIPPSGVANARLLICGTGLATRLEVVTTSGDLFDINSDNWVSFQDLTVAYAQSPSGPLLSGTAFNYTNCQGCNLLRVSMNNCQNGVIFRSTNDVAFVTNCFISYDSNYPKASIAALTISTGAETYVTNCVFRALLASGSVSSSQYGVVVNESSYAHFTDMQIENFFTGIELGNTTNIAMGAMFVNVRVATSPPPPFEIPVALSITPNVYDVRFIGCHFQNIDSNPNSGKNIVIDPGSSGASSIDTIIFESCTSKTSAAYGIEIKGGQNIQILGGVYSGNGSGGAGIAITGGAYDVQIVGANCNGNSEGGTPQLNGISVTAGSAIQIVGVSCSGNSGTGGAGIMIGGTASDVTISGALCNGPLKAPGTPQQYGIYVTDSAGEISIRSSKITGSGSYGIYVNLSSGDSTSIYVSDCDLTGSPSAISVVGTPAIMEVDDCAGYNDAHSIINSNSPPTTTAHNAASKNGYYGPSLVSGVAPSAVGGLSVTLNSQTFSIQSSAFFSIFLNSAYDTIQFSTTFSQFTWTGE